jgi:methyl-accepting chemotaxis protein
MKWLRHRIGGRGAGAATNEISRNVQQAAQGTGEVSRTIEEVTAAAGETGAGAKQVLSAAGDLTQQSEFSAARL